MNATTSTATELDPTTDAERRSPRRPILHRLLVVAALMLSILGLATAAATPALADSTAYGNHASYCFVHEYGGPYQHSVYLQEWTPAYGWVDAASSWGTASGCDTFYDIPTNRTMRFVAYQWIGNSEFVGVSGEFEMRGHNNWYDMGTNLVFETIYW